MKDNGNVLALIKKLGRFKPGAPLKNYITHVRFPMFKNIEPGTRIDFEFPFTALVGANGSGKTSILHALYGMPFGYTTSRFWFSTNLDPISEKPLQRYIYGYWHDEVNGIVETRKARISNKRDYWEPYRASKSDGMEAIPEGEFEGKSRDRWNPVKRKVRYINSRAIFGSFDRYLYFNHEFEGAEKRLVMLRAAERLRVVKEKQKQSYIIGKRERIFENRMLTDQELFEVSKILGRSYDSAQLIQHSLYPGNRGKDFSVIFKRGTQYSEAFAGSGEVAAVYIVIEMLAAQDFSLILLDEPETSLHPGAQKELFLFLLGQILLKKHQIVVSTHSSEFLSGLPHNAIKVFEDNGEGKARVLRKSSPSVALNRLGYDSQENFTVLVEDLIAKELVLQAARGLDQGFQRILNVQIAPGGAESILKFLGPSQMLTGGNVFVLLDGDKRKVEQFTDPKMIPPSKYDDLDSILISEIGLSPQFFIPGGAAKNNAKTDASLQYLSWLRTHLDYLPHKIPEISILNWIRPSENHSTLTSEEAKNLLKQIMTSGVSRELTAEYINMLTIVEIAKMPDSNECLTWIRSRLETWMNE